MNPEQLQAAPANDEPPTTRLRPISDDDDVDAVDRSEHDAGESPVVRATPVINLDADSSFSVGSNDTP
jgi:hypothetical protein